MGDNIQVNGITYPDVESLSLETPEGRNVMYYPDAVRYNEQELTEDQQTQARENIGAASAEEVKRQSEEIANKAGLPYFVCSTAADTAAKTIDADGFELKEGMPILVKFTNANSVASPTLNIGGTGAKPLYRYGTTAMSTGTTTTGWVAGAVMLLIYDGTGWIRDYWNNTTYSNVALGQGYATCSTAEATVAKVGTLSSYALTTGGIVAVKFTYGVPVNATLNINSKGAKAIYYRGATITAGIIKAGDVATFIYNGSQYHLLSIDRWQNDIDGLAEEIANLRDNLPEVVDAPVKSVNGKTGAVVLNASDVGATTKAYVDGEVADLNVKLQQYHLNIAEGDTVEEALAWLEVNGDETEAYVLPDGFIYTYQETVVSSGPSYTNRIPLSINSTGADYVGDNGEDGYRVGYRVSSSGEEKASTTNCCTGFIPCVAGDVIRIKNTTKETQGYSVAYYFTETFGKASGNSGTGTLPVDANGVSSFTVPNYTSIRYVRITEGKIDDTSIVTVNEEITEGGGTSIVEAWTSTGHSFIPADYDDDIASLKRIATEHANDIAELKEGGVSAKSITMFISPDGSDENDGLSADTPKKTVKACVNAGATRISAKRGVYNEIVQLYDVDELEIFPTDNDLTYAVGTEREPIVFETVDYITPSSLATYNSIKRVAYSNSANTQFDKVFVVKSQTPIYGSDYGSRYNATVWLLSEDEKTVCIKLKPVLTVAECEAETNTFTYVSGYLYINASMTGVDKVVVPTNWGVGFYINGAGKIVFREVEVRFAGSYNIDIRNCSHFDFYECACKYTSYGSGFHPFNSNGVLTNCYATKNYDGYGVSGYGHTTYIDCISEFNFDDGVSHHDGTKGTFIGGRYEGNGKGGNTPAYGAEVNIYGGLYKDNAQFGIGYLYTSDKSANGIVQGAVMVGNTVGISVNANCQVTMMSCVLKDNDTERNIHSNAILTEYGTVRS